MTWKRHYFILFGPLVALLFALVLGTLGLPSKGAITAGITLLTVVWWVSEAVPIPLTSLVPFALFPLFNIIDQKTVACSFGSSVILLLMGAFMLSKSLEKSGAHERLAVHMIHLIGASSGRRVVLGFMVASALLSMWISNTATTLILLPIALAILERQTQPRFTIALILGIAYASSLGGIGSPIGTPPNVIFMAIYEEQSGQAYGFLDWMQIGLPIVVLALPIMAIWLTRGVTLDGPIQLPQLGSMRAEEKRTLLIFAVTAVAWVTRNEPFGGWSQLLDLQMVGDSTVALTAVLLLSITPNGQGGRLLDWETAKSIPWDMLLLFAGGIAIAKGFALSGLSDLLGSWLSSLAGLPLYLMILTICLVVTYLTELTSNTATATLLMPILAVAAQSAGFAAPMFMIPAAMSASCAFMLPVASPPNAIAYGTECITMRDMVREGAILSFLVANIVALICTFSLA